MSCQISTVAVTDALQQITENALRAIKKEGRMDKMEIGVAVANAISREYGSWTLLPYITHIERLGAREQSFLKEQKGVTVHLVAPGGYIETSLVDEDSLEIPRVDAGFHVYEFADKVDPHKILDTLTTLGPQRFDAALNNWAFSTIRSAVDTEQTVLVHQLPVLLSLVLSDIRDASYRQSVSIVDRAPVIDRLRNKPGWRNDYFEGAKAITVTNHLINDGLAPLIQVDKAGTFVAGDHIKPTKSAVNDSWIGRDELFVISRRSSRWTFFGTFQPTEWTDPASDEWHLKVKQSFGFVVHHPEYIRRFKVIL